MSQPIPRVKAHRPKAAFIGMLVLVGCAVLYLGLYANAATLDVAYADYLLPPFITAVDACMSGQDCAAVLLAPTSNGYRWTVPALLLSVNAISFGLNTRFELLLGFVGLGLASLTLYVWMSTTWLRAARPAAALAAWIPCLYFLTNLNQWENIVLGIGGYHLLGLAALMPCLWAIDHALRSSQFSGGRALVLLLVLAGASLLLLQYFAVLAAAAALLTLLAIAAGQRRAIVVLAAVLAGAAVGLILTFVPAASLGQSSFVLLGPGDLATIGRFVLNMLAAALLQWEGNRLLADAGYVLGLTSLIAFAAASWLFFAQRMYRTSWLPLALCVYGLLACVVVSFSRFRYGADYGFASRYTSQTALGFLGCYLVLVKALDNRTQGRGAIGFLAVFSLGVVAMQAATHVVQWKIAPHRQAYYREMAHIAARFEQATDAELARFQVPLESVRLALPTLKRHRLSYFR